MPIFDFQLSIFNFQFLIYKSQFSISIISIIKSKMEMLSLPIFLLLLTTTTTPNISLPIFLLLFLERLAMLKVSNNLEQDSGNDVSSDKNPSISYG